MQTIITHLWTKLDGYELDVVHQAGRNITVWVEDGELKNDANVEVMIRPCTGTYAAGWKAPIRGAYLFGGLLPAAGSTTAVNFDLDDMVVLRDASSFIDEFGKRVHVGPEIAMNSGGILDTSERAPTTVEWTSP